MLLHLVRQRIERLQRAVVAGACVIGGIDADELDEVDKLLDMVEDDKLVVEAEADLGEIPVVGGGVLKAELARLGVADRVVGAVAEPAAEHALGQQTPIA